MEEAKDNRATTLIQNQGKRSDVLSTSQQDQKSIKRASQRTPASFAQQTVSSRVRKPGAMSSAVESKAARNSTIIQKECMSKIGAGAKTKDSIKKQPDLSRPPRKSVAKSYLSSFGSTMNESRFVTPRDSLTSSPPSSFSHNYGRYASSGGCKAYSSSRPRHRLRREDENLSLSLQQYSDISPSQLSSETRQPPLWSCGSETSESVQATWREDNIKCLTSLATQKSVSTDDSKARHNGSEALRMTDVPWMEKSCKEGVNPWRQYSWTPRSVPDEQCSLQTDSVHGKLTSSYSRKWSASHLSDRGSLFHGSAYSTELRRRGGFTRIPRKASTGSTADDSTLSFQRSGPKFPQLHEPVKHAMAEIFKELFDPVKRPKEEASMQVDLKMTPKTAVTSKVNLKIVSHVIYETPISDLVDHSTADDSPLLSLETKRRDSEGHTTKNQQRILAESLAVKETSDSPLSALGNFSPILSDHSVLQKEPRTYTSIGDGINRSHVNKWYSPAINLTTKADNLAKSRNLTKSRLVCGAELESFQNSRIKKRLTTSSINSEISPKPSPKHFNSVAKFKLSTKPFSRHYLNASQHISIQSRKYSNSNKSVWSQKKYFALSSPPTPKRDFVIQTDDHECKSSELTLSMQKVQNDDCSNSPSKDEVTTNSQCSLTIRYFQVSDRYNDRQMDNQLSETLLFQSNIWTERLDRICLKRLTKVSLSLSLYVMKRMFLKIPRLIRSRLNCTSLEKKKEEADQNMIECII